MGWPSGSTRQESSIIDVHGASMKILFTPLKNFGLYVVKKKQKNWARKVAKNFFGVFFISLLLWPTGPCSCMYQWSTRPAHSPSRQWLWLDFEVFEWMDEQTDGWTDGHKAGTVFGLVDQKCLFENKNKKKNNIWKGFLRSTAAAVLENQNHSLNGGGNETIHKLTPAFSSNHATTKQQE